MFNLLFVLVLIGDPVLSSATTVKEGNITLSDGREIEIKGGTYIPSPADKKLAKEIVEDEAKIKKLEIQLESSQNRFMKSQNFWQDREKKITTFYKEENLDLKKQLLEHESWWNQYGRVIFWSTLAAAAAAGVTYTVVK